MTTYPRHDSGLRYIRVADLLRDRILQGHYQPGMRLPRQHDLAKETGVSFGTLKVALDVLEREGYLVRKVGQGTYAALPEAIAAVALIIDDDPKFCSYVTEALSISGWDSITANSGQAGIAELRERKISLILLDLVLPGMDGAQIFKEIRKLDQNVPVVIVTGYPDSEIMLEALKVGPFAVVRKPFRLEQLGHILAHLVGGASPLPTSGHLPLSGFSPQTPGETVPW